MIADAAWEVTLEAYGAVISRLSLNLKPCPFCGSNTAFLMGDVSEEWIACDACRATGPRSSRTAVLHRSGVREDDARNGPASDIDILMATEAAATWNERRKEVRDAGDSSASKNPF